MTLKDVCADRVRDVDKVLKKIQKKFDGDSSEENIHDIRTSIRRLQSAFKVLPRRVRERKSLKKYMEACNDLFKVLNDIRDFDVMLSRISKYPENEALKDAISSVTKKRSGLVGRAQKKASAIKDSKSKKLKIPRVSEAQLVQRFQSRVNKQAKKVRDDLPLVWTGKAKKTQIHRLRKDCKKLRYTLELEEKKYEKHLPILKEWQRYLGTVHDVEMTQEMLRKKNRRGGALDSIIKAEESKGTESYEAFMSNSRNEEARAAIDTLVVGASKTRVGRKRVMNDFPEPSSVTQTNEEPHS